MEITHDMARDYAARTLAGMVNGSFRILETRAGLTPDSVTVVFQPDGYETAQCFDVWFEDMGNGPILYGEW